MINGKLRISPNLPKAWNRLSYTLLWKGQRLHVTVTPETVHVTVQEQTAPITLEVWGKEYVLQKELTVTCYSRHLST